MSTVKSTKIARVAGRPREAASANSPECKEMQSIVGSDKFSLISKKTGVGEDTISRYWRGKSPIPLWFLLALRQAYKKAPTAPAGAKTLSMEDRLTALTPPPKDVCPNGALCLNLAKLVLLLRDILSDDVLAQVDQAELKLLLEQAVQQRVTRTGS